MLPTATPGRSVPETPSPAATETPSPTPNLTLADADGCAVTQPTTTPPEIGDRLFGSGSAYGNDDLWVGGLGQDGIMGFDEGAVHGDGSIGTKLGWWRNVPGTVVISGRRLDAPAPPLSARASEEGYPTIGFQPSGVSFPTQGCWEVTGTVGESELTFVTFVFVRGEASRAPRDSSQVQAVPLSHYSASVG